MKRLNASQVKLEVEHLRTMGVDMWSYIFANQSKISPRALSVCHAQTCTAGEFREYLAHVDDADLDLLTLSVADSRVKTKLFVSRLRRRSQPKT